MSARFGCPLHMDFKPDGVAAPPLLVKEHHHAADLDPSKCPMFKSTLALPAQPAPAAPQASVKTSIPGASKGFVADPISANGLLGLCTHNNPCAGFPQTKTAGASQGGEFWFTL